MTYPSDNEEYLKVGEVAEALGVARTTIYKWVRTGHFPKPLVLGPENDKNSTTRWLRTEIDDWIRARPREKSDG